MARLPVKLTPAQLAAYSAAARQYTPPQPPTPTLPPPRPGKPGSATGPTPNIGGFPVNDRGTGSTPTPKTRTPNEGGTLGPGSQSVARGVELLRNMRLEDPEAARYFNSRIQTPVTAPVTVTPSMPQPRPMPSPNPRPVPRPGMPGSATGPTPNIGGMPGAIMKKGGKVMAKAPVKKAASGKVAAKPVAKKAGGKVAAKPMAKGRKK